MPRNKQVAIDLFKAIHETACFFGFEDQQKKAAEYLRALGAPVTSDL